MPTLEDPGAWVVLKCWPPANAHEHPSAMEWTRLTPIASLVRLRILLHHCVHGSFDEVSF